MTWIPHIGGPSVPVPSDVRYMIDACALRVLGPLYIQHSIIIKIYGKNKKSIMNAYLRERERGGGGGIYNYDIYY